jgi:hypothetical protein
MVKKARHKMPGFFVSCSKLLVVDYYFALSGALKTGCAQPRSETQIAPVKHAYL